MFKRKETEYNRNLFLLLCTRVHYNVYSTESLSPTYFDFSHHLNRAVDCTLFQMS